MTKFNRKDTKVYTELRQVFFVNFAPSLRYFAVRNKLKTYFYKE